MRRRARLVLGETARGFRMAEHTERSSRERGRPASQTLASPWDLSPGHQQP